ncbi:hypothetical protein ACSVDE_03065 [Pseudalkalibacillus sp. Hm43]|uniref:hypothetical protein n=1 Tax=Pseudalkalibacillus sp. Hm43 TaxID=3450742 RepID=UPI003F41F268
MKKILVMLVVFLLSAGCSQNELVHKEVKMDELDKEISSFFLNEQDENGIYLFQDQGERIYVFLNGWNVKQGEAASSFSNFEVDPEGDTLNIYYEEQTTTEDKNKELDNRMIYEVQFDRDYDRLAIFKNGEETHFSTSSGR